VTVRDNGNKNFLLSFHPWALLQTDFAYSQWTLLLQWARLYLKLDGYHPAHQHLVCELHPLLLLLTWNERGLWLQIAHCVFILDVLTIPWVVTPATLEFFLQLLGSRRL